MTNVLLNFDDDGTVATKGLPVCTRNLDNTTTAVARSRCRSSMIGTGIAHALIPASPEPVVTTAQVSLFNGPKRRRDPNDPSAQPCRHRHHGRPPRSDRRNSTCYPVFAPAVDLACCLPAGAVFADIRTTVKKTWKFRGKKMSYISASCHDRNRKLNVHGVFKVTIGGQTQTQTGDVVQTCRVKR